MIATFCDHWTSTRRSTQQTSFAQTVVQTATVQNPSWSRNTYAYGFERYRMWFIHIPFMIIAPVFGGRNPWPPFAARSDERGGRGSQKYTSNLVAMVNLRYPAVSDPRFHVSDLQSSFGGFCACFARLKSRPIELIACSRGHRSHISDVSLFV